MRQHIPNFFTLSNLFFGCCAVILLLDGQPVAAAWFTLGSFLCDYADGMVARALKVASPMGRELDSLADVVSFGVVPGAMLYGLLASVYCPAFPSFFPWMADSATVQETAKLAICPAALPAFILSMFSAYRLAKFNLDTRQRHYFMGLSTPGCTVFVLGLLLAAHSNQFGVGAFLLAQPWLLYVLIGLFSYLLVSDIPMFGLKFRSLRWQENKMPSLFLVLAVTALIFLKGLGLSLVILLYIVLSLFSKNKIRHADPPANPPL
jgi:CDP-diacylglycerol--serine O-phosphatidyltransferase